MKKSIFVPRHIQNISGYKAGKTIAEVKKVYQPKRIAKLASNENRYGCSNFVKEAIQSVMGQIQDYPDPLALQLRKEIARINQVSESEVLVGAGSESLISILCRTFFDADDFAVTAHATFVGFFVQAGVLGIDVKKLPLTKDFRFDVDSLIETAKQGAKLVYIANPNNPTGTYISRTEYEKLLNLLPDDILLVMDEAYFEYAETLNDYPNAAINRRENVIVLRTFSKAYGLAGLRVGYAIADEFLVSQMAKVKLTFEPTTTAQAVALAALNDQDFIKESVKKVEEGKRKLYHFFDRHHIRYIESAANSVLMICDSTEEAIMITNEMLKMGVILRRVNAFGLPNCIRITIGTRDDMNHFEGSFTQINELIKG